MTYSLEQFCQDAREALSAHPNHAGRDIVRGQLEKLLVDPDFVASTLGDDQPTGARTIHEDPDLGFCVLAYVTDSGQSSPPHDHGNSWAVYGQAAEHTDMKVYERVDGADGAGDAELKVVKEFRLDPGMAGLFDVGDIHAIDYPKGARFVRVTGADLNHVERLRYDEDKGAAEVISDQGVPHPDKG